MYLKIIVRGLFRKKKTAKNVFIAAMLSAVFISLILLYSDNIERYIKENNFNNSGNWFIAVKSPKNEDFSDAVEILDAHSYFDTPGYITDLYTLKSGDMEFVSGICDERAFEIARFNVLKGRLPEKEGEAVITKETAKKLGISFTTGMQLDFTYKAIKETKSITITLVGIVDDYSASWKSTIAYPSVIFSCNPFDTDDYSYAEAAFYPIKDEYSDVDAEELYFRIKSRLVKTGINAMYIEHYFIYNTNAYKYTLWYTKSIARAVEAVVLIAGIIIMLQVTYTYTNGRKPDYVRLYGIGATKHQVRLCIFVENFLVCIIGQLAGIILAVASTGIILYVASLVIGIEFFYIFKPGTLLKMLIVCVLSSSAAVFPVAVTSARTGSARKHFKRIRNGRAVINYVFTGIMSALIMLCAVNIYEVYIEYKNTQRNDLVFSMYRALVPGADSQNTKNNIVYTDNSSIYSGVGDEFIDELVSSQSAIKKVNRLSIDQMHTYSWDNMDNATFNRLARLYAYMWYNYRLGISGITYSIDMDIPDDIVDENYYDNEQIIIVDDSDYLLELLGRLGIKIDAEAFKNGDCVVFCDGYTYANYCLNNYAIPSETDSDEVFLLNIPEEVSIKSGDTLYFDCYAGNLTATVGAKLSYADVLRLPISFSQLAGIYSLDDVAENGGFMPHDGIAYHVIASKAFAERLAAADGNRSSYKLQYNTIGIEYDHSVNYMAQLDEAVNFYENYKKNNPAQFIYLNGETYVGGLSSMDNDSDKAENAYSRYRQSNFMYSVLFIIFCIMYIVIKQNMILLLKMADKSKTERYILLGADKSFFAKRNLKASIKESLCVLPGLLISAAYAYFVSVSDGSKKYAKDIAGARPFTPYEVFAVLGITATVIIVYIIVSGMGVYNERDNNRK